MGFGLGSVFSGAKNLLFGNPDTVKPFDPWDIMDAQNRANFTVNNPFGRADTSRGFLEQSLNPQLQGLFDQQIGNQARFGQVGNDLLNQAMGFGSRPTRLSGLPGMPGALNPGGIQGPSPTKVGADFGGIGFDRDWSADRANVEGATFDRARKLLDPVFSQREDQLRQSLANRGLRAGGEAFGTEMDLFNKDRTDAYERAALDSVLAGGQEQSRMTGLDQAASQFELGRRNQQFGADLSGTGQFFNQQLGAGQFGLGAQGQAFAQGLGARDQSVREQLLNAQLSDSARGQRFNEALSVFGMPQYNPAAFMPAPFNTGANAAQAYSMNQMMQQNNANARNANDSSMRNGLMGAAGWVAGNPGAFGIGSWGGMMPWGNQPPPVSTGGNPYGWGNF